jgi:hypothetical protein
MVDHERRERASWLDRILGRVTRAQEPMAHLMDRDPMTPPPDRDSMEPQSMGERPMAPAMDEQPMEPHPASGPRQQGGEPSM